MSVETELAEVKAAISAVLKAQSYKLDGVEVTRANLLRLQERERDLESKLTNTIRRGPRLAGFSIRHS